MENNIEKNVKNPRLESLARAVITYPEQLPVSARISEIKELWQKHQLIIVCGATGSGKSVCINTLIASLIYKAAPEDVRLLMIDPKVVELSVYNGIPHLLIPVVTDPKKASA